MTTLGALELTPQQRQTALSRLTAAHGRNIDATIRATMNQVYLEFTTGNWIGTGAWPTTYTTIVGNSQAQIAAQAAGYYAEYTSLVVGEPLAVAPAGDMAWMVKPDSLSAQAMPKRYGLWRNRGLTSLQALERAGRYGAELSAGDNQFAQRAAGRGFVNWSEVPIRGFRKIPSGAPCGWCIVTADQLYRTENVPWHQGCRCGVAPAVPGDGWTPRRLSGDPELQDFLLDSPSSADASSISASLYGPVQGPIAEAVNAVNPDDILPDPFG